MRSFFVAFVSMSFLMLLSTYGAFVCVCLCLRIWGFVAINGDVILYILILLWPNDCLPSLSLSFLVSLSLCLLLSLEMDVDACSIFVVVYLYFVALHIQHIFYCD